MEHKKSSGDIALWVLSIGIVIYTAFRSVHLVQATMPENAKQLGYFALFALDAALLIWTWYAINSAVTPIQVTVSMVMVYFQIIALVLAIMADTVMVFSGQQTEMVFLIAAWAIPMIIGLNIAAAITCKIFTVERGNRIASKEFQAQFEQGTIAWMREHAPDLVAQHAPGVAAARLDTQLAGLTGKSSAGKSSANVATPAASFATDAPLPPVADAKPTRSRARPS